MEKTKVLHSQNAVQKSVSLVLLTGVLRPIPDRAYVNIISTNISSISLNHNCFWEIFVNNFKEAQNSFNTFNRPTIWNDSIHPTVSRNCNIMVPYETPIICLTGCTHLCDVISHHGNKTAMEKCPIFCLERFYLKNKLGDPKFCCWKVMSRQTKRFATLTNTLKLVDSHLLNWRKLRGLSIQFLAKSFISANYQAPAIKRGSPSLFLRY